MAANPAGTDTAYRQRVASYYIISGARQGLSGAAVLRTLQSVGLGYRTETFYDDYNYYKENATRLPRLSNIDRQWYLPENLFVKIPSRGSNFYKYNFEVKAFNAQTGEYSTRIMSTTLFERTSPFEAFQQLANALEEKYSYLAIDETGSSYQGGFAFSV